VKPHYHHDVTGVVIQGLEIMIFFHAMRFLAAKAAGSSNKLLQQTGVAVGGAFTFGGHP
jgi:hypothetical protein